MRSKLSQVLGISKRSLTKIFLAFLSDRDGLKDDCAFSLSHRNSLRFWYYASLSTFCQNLEKNGAHWENLGERGGQTLRDLPEKSAQF